LGAFCNRKHLEVVFVNIIFHKLPYRNRRRDCHWIGFHKATNGFPLQCLPYNKLLVRHPCGILEKHPDQEQPNSSHHISSEELENTYKNEQDAKPKSYGGRNSGCPSKVFPQ